MLSHVIQVCLTTLLGGLIICFTVAILAMIIYILAGCISSLVETFKAVRAKQRFTRNIKYLSRWVAANEAAKQENDSREPHSPL